MDEIAITANRKKDQIKINAIMLSGVTNRSGVIFIPQPASPLQQSHYKSEILYIGHEEVLSHPRTRHVLTIVLSYLRDESRPLKPPLLTIDDLFRATIRVRITQGREYHPSRTWIVDVVLALTGMDLYQDGRVRGDVADEATRIVKFAKELVNRATQDPNALIRWKMNNMPMGSHTWSTLADFEELLVGRKRDN